MIRTTLEWGLQSNFSHYLCTLILSVSGGNLIQFNVDSKWENFENPFMVILYFLSGVLPEDWCEEVVEKNFFLCFNLVEMFELWFETWLEWGLQSGFSHYLCTFILSVSGGNPINIKRFKMIEFWKYFHGNFNYPHRFWRKIDVRK